jgi:uncharacterized membrane protein
MFKNIKKISLKLSLAVLFMLTFVLAVPFLNNTTKIISGEGIVSSVSAQNGTSVLCTIFPFLEGIAFAGNLCGGDSGASNAVGLGITLVQTALSLVFVGIISVAVYTIIRAALKYIRAEGDDSKVEEAQKSIKRVFIGIGALLVGIIGLAIIISLFGATGGLNTQSGIDTEALQDCLKTGTIDTCQQ